MLKDEEFKRIRYRLAEGVGKICAECEMPRIGRSQLNLANPEQCTCRCDKVNGLCDAMTGIDVADQVDDERG